MIVSTFRAVSTLGLIAIATLALLERPAAAQSADLPTERQLSRFNLTRAWWAQAVIDSTDDFVTHVTLDEDAVYVQTNSGLITAIHAENGRRLWSVLLGRPNAGGLPVSSNETEVLFVIGLKCYAVSKFTGDVMWELDLPHHPSVSPEMDATQVYFGMADGSVYAFNLDKVRYLHQQDRLPKWSNNASVWRYRAPLEIVSPPVSNGTVVTFASRNGTMYAVAAGERKLIYQYETDARTEIATPLGRSHDAIFIATDDTRLTALNAVTGVRRWSFTAGVPINVMPRVIGDTVFVAPLNDGLYALSAASGLTKWRQPQAMHFLAATTDYIFASDTLGGVLLLGYDDGAVLGSISLPEFTVHLANDRTDRLVIATEKGLVLCLREKGEEFPIYHLYPERRPILPEFAPKEGEAMEAKGDDAATGEAVPEN